MGLENATCLISPFSPFGEAVAPREVNSKEDRLFLSKKLNQCVKIYSEIKKTID